MSAVLCGVFIAAIAAAVRRRDRLLASAREQALRDERIVAMGTLAAGVAHEINTPLATMALAVDELDESPIDDPDFRDNLAVLRRQVQTCRARLEALVNAADAASGDGCTQVTPRQFMQRVVDGWRVVRPEVDVTVEWAEPFNDAPICEHRTIAQSIANLLNNAADASRERDSHRVDLRVASDADGFEIVIDDFGPGFDGAEMERLGHAVFSTKPAGMGVGLILSNATIDRFGGQVLLSNRPDGGARTEVRIPRRALVDLKDVEQ